MLNPRLALDIGTANSRLKLEEKKISLSVPSLVAVNEETDKVVAVGESAKIMMGRSGKNITFKKPIKNGVISSIKLTEVLIGSLIAKALGPVRFFKPDIMITVPAFSTQVERRAIADAAANFARKIYLIDQPLAAALGAKVPIEKPSGSLVVSLGAGICESAIISLGTIVNFYGIKTGGERIDQIIISYIQKKHNLTIDHDTAEKIKIDFALAEFSGKSEVRKIEVSGQDSLLSIPKSVTITDEEINNQISKFFQEIFLCVKKVFENSSPELSSDIINKGILITGGLAKLKNLNKLISQQTGIACFVAPKPEEAAINGASLAINNLEEFEKIIKKS